MVFDPASTRDPRGVDLSLAAIKAVAKVEGTDPINLKPLYEAIDPEALDVLFTDKDGTTGRIVFQYHGYDVTVNRDGEVTLKSRDES